MTEPIMTLIICDISGTSFSNTIPRMTAIMVFALYKGASLATSPFCDIAIAMAKKPIAQIIPAAIASVVDFHSNCKDGFAKK